MWPPLFVVGIGWPVCSQRSFTQDQERVLVSHFTSNTPSATVGSHSFPCEATKMTCWSKKAKIIAACSKRDHDLDRALEASWRGEVKGEVFLIRFFQSGVRQVFQPGVLIGMEQTQLRIGGSCQAEALQVTGRIKGPLKSPLSLLWFLAGGCYPDEGRLNNLMFG